MSVTISKESYQFLREIAANNDRDWFAEHKPRYVEYHKEFKAVMEQVEKELNAFDSIEKTKVFRIYRDVRFSKNKTPYKTNFSAGFTREGKYRRGGFFFSMEPGNNFIGGGFWNPESKDLRNIREGIIREEEAYRKLLKSKEVKDFFGGIHGDAVKTAPKGFQKDHPAIDLIRNKQFLLSTSFTDEEICSPDFPKKLAQAFQKMIPYFSFITDLLIYDENGVERN